MVRQIPGLIDLGPLDYTLPVYDKDAASIVSSLIVKHAVGLSYGTMGPEISK